MLILVRHGESTGNAARLLLGRQEAPLTERGRAQARSVGAALPKVGSVVTSSLGRARETAAAWDLDQPATVDDRWIEVDYGVHDGQPLTDVPADVWRSWRADPDFVPEGGESLASAGLRVRAACEELFAMKGAGARADEPVVVVSHVTPIKLAVCWALGLGDEGTWSLYLANASITSIDWGPVGPVLHQYNHTPWAS